jgi:hypothetical protein
VPAPAHPGWATCHGLPFSGARTQNRSQWRRERARQHARNPSPKPVAEAARPTLTSGAGPAAAALAAHGGGARSARRCRLCSGTSVVAAGAPACPAAVLVLRQRRLCCHSKSLVPPHTLGSPRSLWLTLWRLALPPWVWGDTRALCAASSVPSNFAAQPRSPQVAAAAAGSGRLSGTIYILHRVQHAVCRDPRSVPVLLRAASPRILSETARRLPRA